MKFHRLRLFLAVTFLLLGVVIVSPSLAAKPPKDTTPPLVTITNPNDGATVSGIITIAFSATDENPVVGYEILIDGQLRSDQQSYDWDTTTENDGDHTILCRARDNSKNWGEDTVTVTVDNSGTNLPPSVSIANPAEGSTVSETVTIEVTVDDEDTLTPDIYIDGTLVAQASTYDWDTTIYADGTHEIYAEATDTNGLSGTDTNTVTVDNSETQEPSAEAFKVMTYNIEASGANEDWKQVVKEENPDILILVETGTWDDNGNQTLNEVIDEFNSYFADEVPYVGYCAQDITYSTSGEAILSRYPVVEFNQIPIVPLDDGSDYDVTHDFVEAIIDIDGTITHVFGSHLKAMSGSDNEWRRERETEGIINYMDNLGNVPIMYMGDLNSFSPDDTGDLAPSGDLGYGPMTMKLYPSDSTYGQYSSAVHEFTDVFRTLNPTDPGYTYGHQDPQYTSRIDFLVANSYFNDKLINSTCGDTPTADTGSDHYSVDLFVNWNSTSEPDTTPPAQVTGLTATTASMSQIDLAWDANTETDLSHYRVYRDGSLIAQVYDTFYSDTGLEPSTTYTYEVSARDTSLNEGPKSDPVSATTNDGGSATLIVINEFLPDPYTLYNEEWIELYNPQDLDADLSGYILDDITDGGTNPYTIPDGTIIPGKGFLVFYQGTTGVGLNNAGDTANLIQPDGTIVQDSYSYSSSTNDVSYGRETDGGSTWTTFDSPTPGATNNGTSGSGDVVLLNEFLPDPYSLYSEEWIELYNPSDTEVDISGYILDDITSGGTGAYTIPDGTTIPAYGFTVFYQGVTGIALNNDGDTANFLMPDGTTVLDSYSYSSSTNDVSYGRETDGDSSWTTFDSPTPGESNTGQSATTTVHVSSISFSTSYSSNGRTEYLDITVTVVDDVGSPVEGVTVGGDLLLPDGSVESYTGVSNAEGQVVFTYYLKPNKFLPTGDYTFTVTNLSGTGFEYDSSANVETSDTWTKY
ncbi:MAG: lamin tail domain-containing protein [Candidatus Thorarchaeota archaeon]|nr:lamin tail domain-containing protein [Candidatus Thorarchaeota archaeon]